MLVLLPFGWAGAAREAQAAEETQTPIRVTADKMEYLTEESQVVFTGNALAVQEDVTLSAKTMRVTLAEGSGSGTGAVKRIVAKGDVTFRQLVPESGAERFATGKKGVYDAEEGIVTLSGSPKVWEGKNVIVGEVMKFFLEENRFVAEGQVGLTVFPEGEDGKPKGQGQQESQ
jgi:lipopolysaccharide export system protein LptA